MGETKIGDDTFNVVFDGPEDAPVLVLSNSLGADLSMWDSQVPALARQFRVLRYDARGHGGSSPGKAPYSLGQLARDVLGILDAHGIEQAHFIGLSLGGMVGQWLLANAPERLGRVVLANTCAHYADPSPWNARIAAVRAGGLEAVASGTIERWFTPDFREAEPEIVARIHDGIRNTSVEGYLGCCAAIRDMDQREGLLGVANEVLVIVGEHDLGTPPEAGWAIVDRIAGAQLVTLEAAHLSNVEMPEAFTEAALKFLTAPARRLPKPAPKIVGKPAAPAPRRAPIARRSALRPGAPRAVVAAGASSSTRAAKAGPAKAGAKKSTARKGSAKKSVGKKAGRPARKTAAKKTVTKKSAAKKSAVRKSARKAASKKAAPKKAATRKATAGKGARKATAKKPARKTATRKGARKTRR